MLNYVVAVWLKWKIMFEFLWIINLTLHMVSNEGLLSCLHISLIARTINVPASPNDKM